MEQRIFLFGFNGDKNENNRNLSHEIESLRNVQIDRSNAEQQQPHHHHHLLTVLVCYFCVKIEERQDSVRVNDAQASAMYSSRVLCL